MSARVFVVQKQMRWDQTKGELVPKFDLSPAEKFGAVTYLLSPTAGPFNPGPIIKELRAKLSDIKSTDYLLLIGNPCLIGWALAIALKHTGGKVNLLQWSGKEQSYLPILTEIK
ncbi:MAG: hypothetical protein ACWGQW_08865 [bacterium]